jgi:ferredoxin--NADP+ reductase
VDPHDLDLDAASKEALELDRDRARRNYELLQEYAAREPARKARRIVLRFLVSPVAIIGDERVEAIEIVHNELVEEAGRIVARPTGELETIPCGLVLRSVGYQGVALPGVPFDERRGVIPNTGGRIDGAERTYAAGWIKRGPSGVIGTNKKDATETVDLLLDDARAGRLSVEATDSLETLLDRKGVRYVEYAGWQAIDAAERAAGEQRGRPRVKLVAWEDLLRTGRPQLPS